eukprot:1161124-Pelagomonas_calceolata.AAC.2
MGTCTRRQHRESCSCVEGGRLGSGWFFKEHEELHRHTAATEGLWTTKASNACKPIAYKCLDAFHACACACWHVYMQCRGEACTYKRIPTCCVCTMLDKLSHKLVLPNSSLSRLVHSIICMRAYLEDHACQACEVIKTLLRCGVLHAGSSEGFTQILRHRESLLSLLAQVWLNRHVVMHSTVPMHTEHLPSTSKPPWNRDSKTSKCQGWPDTRSSHQHFQSGQRLHPFLLIRRQGCAIVRAVRVCGVAYRHNRVRDGAGVNRWCCSCWVGHARGCQSSLVAVAALAFLSYAANTSNELLHIAAVTVEGVEATLTYRPALRPAISCLQFVSILPDPPCPVLAFALDPTPTWSPC